MQQIEIIIVHSIQNQGQFTAKSISFLHIYKLNFDLRPLFLASYFSHPMTKKLEQNMSTLVSKTMARNLCSTHKLSITQVCLDTLELGCNKCFRTNGIKISDLVSNPIQAVINNLQNKSSFRKLLHEVDAHHQVKAGFQAFIQQIRKTINRFCDQAIQDYRNKWDNAFAQTNQMLGQIKTAQAHYRSVFQELLQSKFQQGTVYQLQTCLNQFRDQCSEDPTDYLKVRIETWAESTINMPIVDWSSLKLIYQSLTDPQLLSISNFIKPSYAEQQNNQKDEQNEKRIVMLLPDIQNKLKNSHNFVKFNKEGLNIYCQQKGEVEKIGEITDRNDSYFDIGKNSLIGVNYESISFYKYGFGKVVKTKTYHIPGCLNLLLFPECLIVEADGRINRLWLSDGLKEVICLSGSDINYTNNTYEFSYRNSRGQIMRHPALHNQR